MICDKGGLKIKTNKCDKTCITLKEDGVTCYKDNIDTC